MSNSEIRRLPDGELEIMQAIWRLEPPVTRSDIEAELGEKKRLAPTTILTFLTRLRERGFIEVERRGRGNAYTPLIEERDYLAEESRSVLDRLYGGSLAAFAVALSSTGISREDAAELRAMLEEGRL